MSDAQAAASQRRVQPSAKSSRAAPTGQTSSSRKRARTAPKKSDSQPPRARSSTPSAGPAKPDSSKKGRRQKAVPIIDVPPSSSSSADSDSDVAEPNHAGAAAFLGRHARQHTATTNSSVAPSPPSTSDAPVYLLPPAGDGEEGTYPCGSVVAAFVQVRDDSDSDQSGSDDDSGGPARGRSRGSKPNSTRLKESCYQVMIEAYSPEDRMYTVVDNDPDSDLDEPVWRVAEHKIVDFKALATLQRNVRVGERVYALFRDESDDEQTTEFYQAQVVRVLKNGVAVRFEDGDMSVVRHDEFFLASDVRHT
nr:hypothetical protein HK105_007861 [Polyrhizophydium stewartii]